MKKRSLKINAILNTIRQSLTMLFPLITFPYVSRVLGTEEFGKYTFSASIVTYFQLFSAFGISTFAIREGAAIRENKKAVSKLASDLFSFNIITCTIAYVALILLVIFSTKINSYSPLVFTQSLCMVLTLLGLDWVNNVYEDFLYITVRYIIIQIIALASIFLFVRSSADTAKYCLILILGSYGGNLINLFYIRRYISLPRPRLFPIKTYIVPLAVLFVNSLATTIYVNSDVTMIGIFLNDNEVGLYSFSSKIYNILKYFINAAVIVTIPRLASVVRTNRDKYNSLIEKALYALIVFLLPISAGLLILSKQVIMVAGGKGYINGYSSLMILSFSLIFALLGSICTNCILIIHKLEKRVLISTIISATINVLLNLILIPTIGIEGAAITTVIAELVNMIIQSYFIKKELNLLIPIKWKDIISVIVGTAEVVAVCLMVSNLWTESSLTASMKQIGAAVVLSGVVYFTTLILTKNSFAMSLIRKVNDTIR